MRPERSYYKGVFVLLLVCTTCAIYAQDRISVKLTIVSKPSVPTETGLLLYVVNLSTQNVALYTPLGQLTNYIKYYRLDTQTQQYKEIIHPVYQELARERALKDSVFKASQRRTIVDFFGENYNSKSTLYKQFIQDDSLWYDYVYRHTSVYEKSVQDSDIKQFENVTGITDTAVFFTMMKAKERFQDFMNISFLYQQKGEYKIVLDLPKINLRKLTCLAGSFTLQEPKCVLSNAIYLNIK